MNQITNRETAGPLYKFMLMLLIFGGAVWVGAGLMRAFISNELFISGTLNFDESLTSEEQFLLYHLVAISGIVMLSAYLPLLIGAVYCVWKFPGSKKDNGWLVMASLLFFPFVPIEIFTGYLDIKYLLVWRYALETVETYGTDRFPPLIYELQTLASHRIGALSGVPVIAMLCYYTAIVIVVWRPMRRVTTVKTRIEGQSERQDDEAAGVVEAMDTANEEAR